MGIVFTVEDLDCDPFYHGFGPDCANPKLLFAIWRLHITSTNDEAVSLKFYLTHGNDPLLLGNDVVSMSNLLGSKDMLVIPSSLGLCEHDANLPTYTLGDVNNRRTHLAVVPSVTESFNSFLSHQAALQSTTNDNSKARKRAKYFATRLHVQSHLTLRDMKTLCRRGRVLDPLLSDELKKAYSSCHSCHKSGRPLHSRKISFNRILAEFNKHLQVDYLFIRELGNLPILHMKDVATGLSATSLMTSRDMNDGARMLTVKWFDVYGPPSKLSADQEFDNGIIYRMCASYNIKFEPRPARRHNKTGSVESDNETIRALIKTLLSDEPHLLETRQLFRTDFEILSRATFLKNVLYGSKSVSSFEQVHGYTPSIAGLPKTAVSPAVLSAYHEQVCRRTFHTLLRSRAVKTISQHLLSPMTPVYFYKKLGKYGSWCKGYVVKATDHIVVVSYHKDLHGARLHVAYEDVRLVPESSILGELDKQELGWDSFPDLLPSTGDNPKGRREESENEEDHDDYATPSLPIADINPDPNDIPDHLCIEPEVPDEPNLWSLHPLSSSFLSNNSRPLEAPSLDVGDTLLHKDVGATPLRIPSPGDTLHSSEQGILKEGKKVIGDQPVSESKLQFAPRWIIEKAIDAEKRNYIEADAYKPVSIRSLPRNANIISSHHFFVLKYQGESGELRLRCRLVPHGNRDAEKDLIRSDSSTAQFTCIRMLLSLVTLFHFHLGSIDVSRAYLQSGELKRDIYMRPPRGWTTHVDEVWKLLKPAYGLGESGRLWQLCIEEWLTDYGFETIPGMPQLFVLRKDGEIVLLLAKLVDDLLLGGKPATIQKFTSDLARRFKLNRSLSQNELIFSRLWIKLHNDSSVEISMAEFMDTIQPIPISRERRKETEDRCTLDEIKSLQSLAGKLNYVGHGVLPQAAFCASYMQQLVPEMQVKHLVKANQLLSLLKKLRPTLMYLAPPVPLTASTLGNCNLLAYSDASTGKMSYGQTGFLAGIAFTLESNTVYHLIDWHSSKQGRISFSAIGAEILAAAESADRSFLLHEVLCSLLKSFGLLVLIVDSFGLYSTITTLHECRDYRLRPTVSRLRDSFECGDISSLLWVSGSSNIADALTKGNACAFGNLSRVSSTGLIPKELLSTFSQKLGAWSPSFLHSQSNGSAIQQDGGNA